VLKCCNKAYCVAKHAHVFPLGVIWGQCGYNKEVMKRTLIILLSMLSVLKTYGQSNLLDNISVKETNFFYKDSIDNEITYGSYEPTGIISLNDGSLVISTKFSIYFPDQYKTPEVYTQEYRDRQKIYREKSHISSGSVFLLNKDREKQWEIFFKDKPVESIKLLSNGTILVAGQDVGMDFFWIAKISKEGKKIIEKQFKFKRKPNIENVEIDSLDNIYILLSTERLKIIDNTKYYGRRKIRFFQETDSENNIYLLKISPKNKTLWATTIDTRPKYWKFGRDLQVYNSDNYVSSFFEGFKKVKNQNIKEKGVMLSLVGKSGKIKQTYPFDNKKIFVSENQLLFTTSAHNDTLILYKGNFDSLFPFKTIVFDDIKQFWINNFREDEKYNYLFSTHHHNLGCLLILLDKENQYIGHWKDSLDNISSLVDGVIGKNNSVLILARHYSNPSDNSTDKKEYSIKLIEIKKE